MKNCYKIYVRNNTYLRTVKEDDDYYCVTDNHVPAKIINKYWKGDIEEYIVTADTEELAIDLVKRLLILI